MNQLLILSGKGGTGKTTMASAFIKLSNAKAFADCDVDAPNLHLVIEHSSLPKKTDYFGNPKAEIDTDKCINCGKCIELCRFNAISVEDGLYKVKLFDCEGCGLCEYACPAGAISSEPAKAGELMLFNDDDRVFSTAQLKMGSGHSGKLVTEVKRQMRDNAGKANFAIIDGSPGIGCPVIASLSGVDLVLIVAEPSVSGISDMERIIKTSYMFGPQIAVCINKYDTNLINTKKIEEFCQSKRLSFVGKIPFDPEAAKAINIGLTIADVECPSGEAVKQVFNNTMTVFSDQT
ncbi:MAG: ATPase [Firmicutes bacterium HGW-Firmicutes-16]|nr:MAG: ATPase [Firmicutes bacterium HGW-Firmicutes-16]